ncbi:MAG: hypothetical protein ACOVO1_02910 [Chitinophagaceae bacterium]
MEKAHSLKLIDGTFSAIEAESVLSNLIGFKINFHSMESFSNRIRFNQDLAHHEKRISELKAAREHLDLILKEAKDNNKQLIIEGNISISLV